MNPIKKAWRRGEDKAIEEQVAIMVAEGRSKREALMFKSFCIGLVIGASAMSLAIWWWQW